MNKNVEKKLSEEEIDEIVIQEANDFSKWERPIKVTPLQATVLCLNNRIIEKAKFFASHYKMKQYQDWLRQIIEERIQQEERIFNNANV